MPASKLLSSRGFSGLPYPTALSVTGTAYGSNVIPSGTPGKRRGFLGVIWQTGFNTFGYPPDTVSPGWTKVLGVTKLYSNTFWRSSVQYKILTAAELGTTVTYIPYTGGVATKVSLFETPDNDAINAVSVRSQQNSALDNPPAQTLTGSSGTDTVDLYLAMYYAFPLGGVVFSGATPTTLGDGNHQLRFYSSPIEETTKPTVTVDLGANSYSHLSSCILTVT